MTRYPFVIIHESPGFEGFKRRCNLVYFVHLSDVESLCKQLNGTFICSLMNIYHVNYSLYLSLESLSLAPLIVRQCLEDIFTFRDGLYIYEYIYLLISPLVLVRIGSWPAVCRCPSVNTRTEECNQYNEPVTNLICKPAGLYSQISAFCFSLVNFSLLISVLISSYRGNEDYKLHVLSCSPVFFLPNRPWY